MNMGLAGTIMRAAIRGYQLLISPILPGTCRYWPTCSQYSLDAVSRHGALKGGWLAFRRILRCNPWGGWGHDPVPHADRVCSNKKITGAERVAVDRTHDQPGSGLAGHGGEG